MIRTAIALCALLSTLTAQGTPIGSAYGSSYGAAIITYGNTSVGAGAFLDTRCSLASTATAVVAYSFAPSAGVPFPPAPSVGNVLVDTSPLLLIGQPTMTATSSSVSQYTLTIPMLSSYIGTTIYSQCYALDTGGTWALTSGWSVLLTS